MNPLPKIHDLNKGVHVLRVIHPTNYRAVPSQLPEKRLPELDNDRTIVSASIIRRIESELVHDECDPRTVLNFCRGLNKGTREFEDAYFSARIRSFAKHQRTVTDPFLLAQSNARNPLQHHLHATDQLTTIDQLHPWAVNHFGHLMSHFGFFVTALLGLQVCAAWCISTFAKSYFDGGSFMYFSLAVILMLALDSAIWFRQKGKRCDAFLVPGIVLFLMAVMPILILYVNSLLYDMR